VPFCPRCRCEYAVGVPECIDCHVPLVLFRPTRRALGDLDFDELLVPAGALFCLLASVALLAIRGMASSGQIAEPLASLINGQPFVFVVFYLVAAVLSGLLLTILVLRWLFFRG
jgi:hypothetical protein